MIDSMPPEQRNGEKIGAATPWALPADEVLAAFGVQAEHGLAPSEIERRRTEYGRNTLHERRPDPAWRILARQFASLVIALLAAAAAVSLALGHFVEAAAIAVVIALDAGIGFCTELRAVRSMEALRQLGRATARVRRGGSVQAIPADDLVPGDVVLLEAGDVVSADLRLVEASKFEADESALTGESTPVAKDVAPVPPDTGLADRASMLWKATAVTRGAGTAVCVATGMATELGRIATLTLSAERGTTPLEERLDKLARRLVWVTLVIAAVTATAGILTGKPPGTMIETGIALAVAAIPEGLPVVATLALARGLWRLARRGALVNRLSAVETLGATSIILTDKTGTLTENRMTLVHLGLLGADVDLREQDARGSRPGSAGSPDPSSGQTTAAGEHAALRAALAVGALCSNASLGRAGTEGQASGDPMEVALLVAAARAGLLQAELLAAAPERREVAFDPRTRAMATFHADGDGYRVAVKGAVEAVLPWCRAVLASDGSVRDLDEAGRAAWLTQAAALAERGLRVLALAHKHTTDLDDEPYRDLVLLAVAGLIDPPRAEVAAALARCRAAGVRIVMVTGDHAGTALGVARMLDLVAQGARAVEGRVLAGMDRASLLAASVFARVDPEQKLHLIDLHQRAGHVVAMTGDGVNDAPALRKADIGIAMGQRGTQVAREAADMVLHDDSFASIVRAIHQGRTIFANIRRFTVYLLSCNLSEVVLVFAASVAGGPLPLLPLQILYLNLVTDVFPALALGLGEGDPDTMRRPPRASQEPIVTRGLWIAIGCYGALIATAVLAALFVALRVLGLDERRAITVSFLTVGLAQVWHVFDMRDRGSDVLRNDVTGSRWVWGAVVLCVGLLVLAVHGPLLPLVLGTADPGFSGWAVALVASLLPVLVGQAWLSLPWRRRA